MILNGHELGGGSIRIHEADLQASMFKALGISDEESEKFLTDVSEGIGNVFTPQSDLDSPGTGE